MIITQFQFQIPVIFILEISVSQNCICLLVRKMIVGILSFPFENQFIFSYPHKD